MRLIDWPEERRLKRAERVDDRDCPRCTHHPSPDRRRPPSPPRAHPGRPQRPAFGPDRGAGAERRLPGCRPPRGDTCVRLARRRRRSSRLRADADRPRRQRGRRAGGATQPPRCLRSKRGPVGAHEQMPARAATGRTTPSASNRLPQAWNGRSSTGQRRHRRRGASGPGRAGRRPLTGRWRRLCRHGRRRRPHRAPEPAFRRRAAGACRLRPLCDVGHG